MRVVILFCIKSISILYTFLKKYSKNTVRQIVTKNLYTYTFLKKYSKNTVRQIVTKNLYTYTFLKKYINLIQVIYFCYTFFKSIL